MNSNRTTTNLASTVLNAPLTGAGITNITIDPTRSETVTFGGVCLSR